MSETYDVAVIGGGPGGYVAAIRCGQLGLNTVCIDAWKNVKGRASLGGTCLNVGCIPSKALLESSERFFQVQHDISAHGIKVENAAIDVSVMVARKDKIVTTFTAGIASLFKKNNVKSVHGTGKLLKRDDSAEAWRIEVVDGDAACSGETCHCGHRVGATSTAYGHRG